MKKTIVILLAAIMLLSLQACNKSAHTLTFESNGGTVCEPLSTKGKESVSLPTPIRQGYSFDGWFYDNGVFNKAFTSDSLLDYALEEDITLYAKWIKDRTPGGETVVDVAIADVSSRPAPSLTETDGDTEYVCYIDSNAPLSAVYLSLSYALDSWLNGIQRPLATPVTYVGNRQCDVNGNLVKGENIIKYTVNDASGTRTLTVRLYVSEGSQVGEYRIMKHNDCAIVLSYLGASSNVIMPETINDLTVRYISPLAFYANESLTKITIPMTVTQIGENCFLNCKSLTAFDVSENNPAFRSQNGWLYNKQGNALLSASRNTQSVVVPSDVTAISAGCFYGFNIASAEILGAKYIGAEAFKGCTLLQTISLPDTLTYVSDGMLEATAITSLSLPSSARTVGDYAFSYCSKLQAANVNGITSLGSGAFYGCTALAGLAADSLQTVPDSCFEGCSTLYSIDVPATVTEIGAYSFRYCSTLTTVSFAEESTLVSVGKNAFSYCSELSAIALPQTVNKIGSSAFQNSGLNSFTFPTAAVTASSSVLNNCAKLISVDLSNVKKAEANAFSYSGLKTVTIPTSVTDIGEKAFYACSSLSHVFIPSNVSAVGRSAFGLCQGTVLYVNAESAPSGFAETWSGSSTVYYGIGEIGSENGMQYYTKGEAATLTKYDGTATQLVIPKELGGKALQTLGKGAFSTNATLETISFAADSALSEIQERCFFGSSIVTIALPSSLRSAGEYAFASSVSLYAVAIPAGVGDNGLQSIGKYCFMGCSSLASITLPESLTAIEEGTFQSCTSLKTVDVPGSITRMGSSAFDRCSALSEVRFGSGFTTLAFGRACFKQCTSLTAVNLPDVVKSIPGFCFFGCSALQSINLTEIEKVGEQAFKWCSALRYTLGEKLTTIDKEAFWGTVSTASVTLLSNVITIKINAFGNSDGVAITINCMFSTKPEGFGTSWYGQNCHIVWH